jgi:hypothetical protein
MDIKTHSRIVSSASKMCFKIHSKNLHDVEQLKNQHVQQLKRQEEWLKEKKEYEDELFAKVWIRRTHEQVCFDFEC